MNNTKTFQTIIIVAFTLLSPFSWAKTDGHTHDHDNEHDHTETVSHEAHVHGLAELTLAIEGSMVELALKSPAANIVGFEHEASTQEQKQAVEDAKKMLESPKELFVFTGAECESKKTLVDTSMLMSSDTKIADSADNHEGKHHGADKKESSKHSEITANYQFDCKQGDSLSAISVTLLDQFTGIETLNAMWVTDNGQSAAELTAKSKDIKLR